MPKEPKTQCDCCHSQMPKAHAWHEDKAFCQKCYLKHFQSVACDGCGKSIRSFNGEEPALCKSCKVKGRVCGGCGNALAQASSKREDGTALCWPCTRNERDPVTCPMCNKPSKALSRMPGEGIEEAICEHCRNQKTHFTCPACNKYRKPAGLDASGQIVCAKCRSEGPFVCPTCKKPGVRHSAKKCQSCYWSEHASKAIERDAAMLPRIWTRTAYKQFGQALVGLYGPQKASHRVSKYLSFFIALDSRYPEVNNVSVQDLIAGFGKDGLRRNTTAVSFLIKAGFLPRATDWELDHHSENQEQERLLERNADKWFHPLLVRFRQHSLEMQQVSLDRGRKGPNAHTIKTWLFGATKLLEYCSDQGIDNIGGIDSLLLEQFVVSSPGYQAVLPRFVNYANKHEKVFRKIYVPKNQVSVKNEQLMLTDARSAALIRRFLDPATDPKEALLGILMLLYAQIATRVVKLKLSQISETQSGGVAIKFARMPITLEADIAVVLKRYLETRKALSPMESSEQNEYLFPGRRIGSHLTAASVAYYIERWETTSEQLLSTCLFTIFQSGVRHPNVPHHAFGVSKAVCARYLSRLDSRMTDAIDIRLRTQLRNRQKRAEASNPS